ncbi:hypothetical protein BU16DRAFT_145876 [Lophium mytilinum]|uniref:Uncharacterized protein n=1 Tax=Lophium mytilinum TaxID=390894 RepID=A0A6A6QFT3_9PEZI|nr:hypothetical protein BU16DRAFT_145876 [Lophium mytilinum]
MSSKATRLGSIAATFTQSADTSTVGFRSVGTEAPLQPTVLSRTQLAAVTTLPFAIAPRTTTASASCNISATDYAVAKPNFLSGLDTRKSDTITPNGIPKTNTVAPSASDNANGLYAISVFSRVDLLLDVSSCTSFAAHNRGALIGWGPFRRCVVGDEASGCSQVLAGGEGSCQAIAVRATAGTCYLLYKASTSSDLFSPIIIIHLIHHVHGLQLVVP